MRDIGRAPIHYRATAFVMLMSRRTVFFAVLGALLVGVAIFAIKSKSRPAAAEGEFLSISTDLKPGWQLYTAKEHRSVGLVKQVESDHAFPDGTTQDGVLILYIDATENWVPKEMVKKLYVTRP
jgi:hypothetical protein